MSYARPLLFGYVLLFGTGCGAFATPPPNWAAKDYPKPPELRRGINLGNALDADQEGKWGVTLSEDHFQMAKDAGLDHIRLPARFSGHADKAAPYTIEPAFLSRVDWAIDQALQRGMSIILDMHHYKDMMAEPERNTDRFLGLWKQIAERYVDAPPSVYLELINEPEKKLDAVWGSIFPKAMAVVRAVDPKRTLIVDSVFWANADKLAQLEIPKDPAVIASFHMYEPHLFTHQGVPFMAAEWGTRGIVFPGPPKTPLEPVKAALEVDWVRKFFSDYNRLPAETNPVGEKTIQEQFGYADAYTKRTGIRTYLGEFAVCNNADPESRKNWLKRVREESEKRKIPWTYWDDGGSMMGMNMQTHQWVPAIKEGLFGK